MNDRVIDLELLVIGLSIYSLRALAADLLLAMEGGVADPSSHPRGAAARGEIERIEAAQPAPASGPACLVPPTTSVGLPPDRHGATLQLMRREPQDLPSSVEAMGVHCQ